MADIILKVGTSINIRRSDGRVHSAVVAGVNFEMNSATVEWFEQGETKGKEVDISAIKLLNPEIIITTPINNDEPPPTPRLTQASSNQLQRDSSGSSEEEVSAAMAQSGLFSNKFDESDDDFNSNQFSSETATISNPTRQSIVSYQANSGLRAIRSTTTSQLTNNGHTIQGNDMLTTSRESNIPTSRSTILQNSTLQSGVNYPPNNSGLTPIRSTPITQLTNNGHTQVTEMPAARDSNIPASRTAIVQNSRRSNVVKEVEKLKKNREERRQRQAEEKAEKEAFLQLAPGNPHWELYNMILEYRRSLDIKPLSDHDTIEDHLITVCVRKRPLNKREGQRKEVDVITIPSKNQLIVHEPKNKVDLTKYLENELFRFDYAFDESCSNEMVYRYTAQPLIKTIFEGGFATCFAYGQTGSGKTHTMGGDFNGKNQDCQKGIYAMATSDVFQLANSSKYSHLKFVVSSSFFEIYSGKVFDLLNNKQKLRILEDGKQQVQVVGLTEKVVNTTDEVLKLIQKGNQARTSGQTFANSNSSRSHAVFQIYLRLSTNMQKIHGKFSLIDLAGNERGADTSSADRQTRMEGAEINKSLLALKECIRALGRKGGHLPFRVSKLTQVLRDSFVGSNSRTCMIAMVSPGVNSCEHTLNTLRYADRVKELGGGDLQTNTASEEQDNEDLLQLRSLSENDMTLEMLNFHKVISELQIAEDNMLENHKQVIEELHGAYEKAKKILRMTDSVTYDQEVYCKNLDELIDNSLSFLLRSKEMVADFKAKMNAEEQLSRKTKC